jgi:hypothetical protein
VDAPTPGEIETFPGDARRPGAAEDRARPGTFGFAFIVSALGFLAVFLLGTIVDIALAPGPASLLSLLFGPGQANGDSLLYLAQIVAAILGIALTVVAIVVQLAANRYTAKIIDLFIRDPVNVPTLALFVVNALEAIWVAHIHGPGFVPRVGIAINMTLTTASLLVLVPYFRHVFKFLEPQNVIKRIRNEVIQQIDAAGDLRNPGACARAQFHVVKSLDHLFDIARNSVNQYDLTLATTAVFSLRDVTLEAQREKPRLPKDWYHIAATTRNNADFLNFPEASIRAFEEEGSWLERKVAWQLYRVFRAALFNMHSLCSSVALIVRELGEDALARGAAVDVRLAVRTFNTLVRAAVNARDVRAVFNVFQQYRLFAEHLLASGDRGRDVVAEVIQHFRYYGRIADRAGLGFILETATHDLALLVKSAVESGAPEAAVRGYLDTLLTLDDDAETPLSTTTRRGVRRAQIVLAAHLITRGREDLGRLIFEDVRRETAGNLRAVRAEIAGAEREFFELTERVSSFGYVAPEARPALERFFSWFEKPEPVAEPTPPRGLEASLRRPEG